DDPFEVKATAQTPFCIFVYSEKHLPNIVIISCSLSLSKGRLRQPHQDTEDQIFLCHCHHRSRINTLILHLSYRIENKYKRFMLTKSEDLEGNACSWSEKFVSPN